MAAIEPNDKLLITSRCAQTIFTQRIHLARLAKSKGWQVYLAGQKDKNEYAELLRIENFNFNSIEVNQRSINPFSLIKLLINYYVLIKKIQPTIFHSFTIKPTISGLIAARIFNVPIRIATVAGLGHIFLSSSPLVRLLAIYLLRVSMMCAHRVYFYNQTDCDEYVNRGIVPLNKVRIVAGSGIDTARFPVPPLPDKKELSLAFVGRLLREKGVPELLEAMYALRAKGDLPILHLIGDIDHNNPSSISKLELDRAIQDGLVQWHGHVADIRQLVAQADVIVLPSHREGIPLSLLEGAAMGRALIATDVPGCRDVVLHGTTGLLVPLNDSGALADAIATLANDRAMVADMGKSAREDVVTRFDTNIVNAAVIADYKALTASLRPTFYDV